MKDIIDFIKSLLEAGKDRIRYPFVRAFALTFALYNWRPLSLLLFSEESMEYRIDTIQQCYMQGTGFLHLWHDYIMTPILLALVFFLGMPYLSNWFEQLLSKAKKAKRTSRLKAEDADLTRALEVATKKGEVEDATANWKDRHEMNQENQRLKSLEAAWKTELDDTVKLLDKAKEKNNELDSLLTTVQDLRLETDALGASNSKMKDVLKNTFPHKQIKDLTLGSVMKIRKDQYQILTKIESYKYSNYEANEDKLSREFLKYKEVIIAFVNDTETWFKGFTLDMFYRSNPDYIRAGLVNEDESVSDYGIYVMAAVWAERNGVLELFHELLRDRDNNSE